MPREEEFLKKQKNVSPIGEKGKKIKCRKKRGKEGQRSFYKSARLGLRHVKKKRKEANVRCLWGKKKEKIYGGGEEEKKEGRVRTERDEFIYFSLYKGGKKRRAGARNRKNKKIRERRTGGEYTRKEGNPEKRKKKGSEKQFLVEAHKGKREKKSR